MKINHSNRSNLSIEEIRDILDEEIEAINKEDTKKKIQKKTQKQTKRTMKHE